MGTIHHLRPSDRPLAVVAVVALAHPERLWGPDGAERLAALDAVWLTAEGRGLVARAALHAVRIGFPTAEDALAWAEGAFRAAAAHGDALRGAVVTGRPELREDPLTGRADLVGAAVHASLRLAELASPGELLVDADVAAAAPGAIRAADGWSVRWAPAPEVTSSVPDFGPRPFVGRSAERAAVEAALGRGGVVALVGPPGAGKSRLAAELARARAGAVWVALGAARTAADGVMALGAALGVPLGGDPTPEVALERLARVVAQRPATWVVLDDAEAVAGVGEIVRALGTRVLVTTRTRLGVGEEVALGGLPTDDAVQLLRGDAAWTEAELRDAAAIARAVDGLPLALVLASAAFGVVRPGAVLARLDAWVDLDAAVRRSASLLSDDARRALGSLAVFPGAFGPDAVDAVVELPPAARWAAVRALVDASLARRIGDRFALYEPVRRVAAGWLAARPDADAVRERHAGWVLRGVRDWWRGERAVLTPERDARLRDTWADLVGLVEGESAHAAWAAAALDVVAAARAPVSVRLGWLDRGRAAAERAGDSAALGMLEVLRSHPLRATGRRADDAEGLARAARIAADTGDVVLAARVALEDGRRAVEDGALDRAEARYRSAAEDAQRRGAWAVGGGAARALAALYAYHLDRPAEALAEIELAVRLHERAENPVGVGLALAERAEIRRIAHDPLAAADLARARTLLAAVGHDEGLNRVRQGELWFAIEADDEAAAVGSATEALDWARSVGDHRREAAARLALARVWLAFGRLDRCERAVHEARAASVAAGSALRVASCGWVEAQVAVERGALERADGLLDAVADRPELREWVALARGLVGALRGDRSGARSAGARAEAVDAVLDPAAAARWCARPLEDRGDPDVRWLDRVVRKAAAPRPLAIGDDGRVHLPDGAVVELARRPSLRGIVAALAHGATLTLDDVLAAGWPGERVVPRAATNRVYVAVATLRKLGVPVVTTDAGYRLDPAVPVVTG